jgi:hypothetical protein
MDDRDQLLIEAYRLITRIGNPPYVPSDTTGAKRCAWCASYDYAPHHPSCASHEARRLLKSLNAYFGAKGVHHD